MPFRRVTCCHLFAKEFGYDVDVQFDGDGQHDSSYSDALVE